MKCTNAITIGLFRSASPYMPLVACAVINYSLQNGICDEAASAFFLFGYFKVSDGKYEEGCYWGNVVLKIVEAWKTRATLQADVMCAFFLNLYYCPFKELAFC